MRETPRNRLLVVVDIARPSRFAHLIFPFKVFLCAIDLRPRSGENNPAHTYVVQSGIMTNVYTSDEVARHDNAMDLWIVIHGVVYNVTTFHKEHPGGEEVLLKLAGQDATECFENVGHSYEAINLREIYKIGVLVDGVGTDQLEMTNTEIKEPTEDEWQYQEPKTEIQSWNVQFFCIAVVIYALIIFYWYNKL